MLPGEIASLLKVLLEVLPLDTWLWVNSRERDDGHLGASLLYYGRPGGFAKAANTHVAPAKWRCQLLGTERLLTGKIHPTQGAKVCHRSGVRGYPAESSRRSS